MTARLDIDEQWLREQYEGENRSIIDLAKEQGCSGKAINNALRRAGIPVRSRARLIHGHTIAHRPTATYRSWASMMARCRNPNDSRYRYYGARGIKVCERWLVFENFLTDMGERPEGLTIDRIDGDGNYEPSNCRWATRKVQARHHRKLTDEQVAAIRQDMRPQRVIAAEYGVSGFFVSQIRRGERRAA